MTPLRALPEDRELLLRTLQVGRFDPPEQRARAQALLQQHHYLGAVQAVGEQMRCAVTEAQGEWAAVLVFAAAAWHLRCRDAWIGWSDEQRRRRLALVANNVRFLLWPTAFSSPGAIARVIPPRILSRTWPRTTTAAPSPPSSLAPSLHEYALVNPTIRHSPKKGLCISKIIFFRQPLWDYLKDEPFNL